jgi:hypothetical protein
MQKRHKYWRRQNIGARQDFTDFRQTTAVNDTNDPVHCGRESAHKSGRGQHRQGGEHQRGLGEARYCGLCRVKTVRRCNAGLVHNVHNLRMRQHFVGAYILSTPIFCWHMYFVNTNFCCRQYFVDADILLTPNFCQR